MKEELLKKSLKRELSETDLKTKLEIIFGYGVFAGLGITTVEELLEIDFKDLVEAEKEGKISRLRGIKRDMHFFGCTLKGEYDELGISEEEALIPIGELDICARAKNALIRAGRVDVLGELLAMPYSKLINVRHFGAKSQEDLKVYLESLGYKLQSDGTSVEEMKARLRAEGEVLVEDVIDSRQIMLTLNRVGIYTLDELLERDFRSIAGIGETYEGDIVSSLREYAIDCKRRDSSAAILEKEAELMRLEEERNSLRMKNINLVLEQAEVSAKLKEVKSQIRSMNVGRQYGKK